MGQKNNANGFRKTGLDFQPISDYKSNFQKRYQTKQYLNGMYRNYTLGNIVERESNTWTVEYSKEPKKTPAITKDRLSTLKGIKVVEKKRLSLLLIKLTLKAEESDIKNVGYLPPLDASEVKESNQFFKNIFKINKKI